MKKKIMIIGSGPGLAWDVEQRFGREGWRLVLAARNAERLQKDVDALNAQGIETTSYVCDAGDVVRVDEIVRRESEDGGIDVLNWNAITQRQASILEVPLDAFQHDLMVGVGGAMAAARAALPAMKARGHGTMIFSGGDTGIDPWHRMPIAGAAKAALRNFTKVLTRDPDCKGLRFAYVGIDAHIVGPVVGPELAEIYWKLHNDPQPPATWDVRYHHPYDRPYEKDNI